MQHSHLDSAPLQQVRTYMFLCSLCSASSQHSFYFICFTRTFFVVLGRQACLWCYARIRVRKANSYAVGFALRWKVAFSTFAWGFAPKMLEIGLPRLRMIWRVFSKIYLELFPASPGGQLEEITVSTWQIKYLESARALFFCIFWNSEIAENSRNKGSKFPHNSWSSGPILMQLWWCYLLSYRGKRSIDYPAQGKPYNILPPLERRDLWDVSVDGSPYTVVRAYPNFDPNPGGPGRHV